MLKFESDYERLSNKDILLKLGLKKKLLVSLSREGGGGGQPISGERDKVSF